METSAPTLAQKIARIIDDHAKRIDRDGPKGEYSNRAVYDIMKLVNARVREAYNNGLHEANSVPEDEQV